MVNDAALAVWLYGDHIATIEPHRERIDRIHWRWTPQAVVRWGNQSRIVGHNLVTSSAGSTPGSDARATVFVQGLLPEGEARVHQAVAVGVDPDDVFGLLATYGQDTAGGLRFVADQPNPSSPTGQPVSTKQIAQRLREVTSRSAGATVQSTSLAGMIPKIGVNRAGKQWFRPDPGALSTWILKVGHPEDSPAGDVIDTEALCLALARRLQLSTINAEVVHFGDVRALAVQRYDRRVVDGHVHAVHQEDLAQAIGLSTADPARKFQRGANLPSWGHAARVLRASGGRLAPLARLVTFSFLVGNTDHHAKNTSFLRPERGPVQLAPAYDVAAHLHHPGGHTTALDIAGLRNFSDLTPEHVVAEIESWGIPVVQARAAVQQVSRALSQALDELSTTDFAGVPTLAWEVLRERARLAAENT